MYPNRSATGVVERLRDEARAYYELCARADRVGVSTSLGDPRSPATVAALRTAVEEREAAR